MKERLRRILKEPLLAFFGLAVAIFALHGARAPAPEGTIEVRRADVVRAQTARLGRAPSEAELEAAIARAAQTEALVRRARDLGLAERDPIVRRRLAQKMELLAEDLATLEPATEAELDAHLRAHPERYARPERRTVRHVFLGETADGAQDVLWKLEGGADPRTLGRSFAAGRRFADRTERGLGGVLGADLARAAFSAPRGAWTGPVRSVFGAHLVWVERIVPAREAQLSEVRAAVERDVEQARREAARAAVRDKALDGFRIEAGP